MKFTERAKKHRRYRKASSGNEEEEEEVQRNCAILAVSVILTIINLDHSSIIYHKSFLLRNKIIPHPNVKFG